MRVFGNCNLHIDLGGMLESGSREFLVGVLWSLWEEECGMLPLDVWLFL